MNLGLTIFESVTDFSKYNSYISQGTRLSYCHYYRGGARLHNSASFSSFLMLFFNFFIRNPVINDFLFYESIKGIKHTLVKGLLNEFFLRA